jgi:hypothetical protein
MKTALFYPLLGAAVLGVLLMGGITPALAQTTSIEFFSDAQTYVVSSTATSTMYSTPEDQTNFYGKGAMMISAPVVDPGTAYAAVPRAMDSLFSFNTGTNQTGSAGTYPPASTWPTQPPPTGVNVVSAFNTAYGVGNWTITDVSIALASNYTQQGYQPNNDDFNQIASGQFTLEVLGGNPTIASTTAGQTWNTLQAYLPTVTVTSAGTFQWNATGPGTNNTGTEPQTSYDLTLTPALINAILTGEFTMLGVAADGQVGYLFNTANRLSPEITITATEDAVPIPAAAWLLGPGLVGLGYIRRRIMA